MDTVRRAAFPSLAALLALATVTRAPQHIAPKVAAVESAERSFLESRGEAPANARHRAFEQLRLWHALHDAARPNTYMWQSIGPAPAHYRGVGQTGRVTAVLLSPLDRNLVVVGTSGGGIWRSTDGGVTFVPVSDDQADIAVGAMAIAPSNPNVMYAAMGDDHLGTGILKSTDSGATWRVVTTAAFAARSSAGKIIVDPNDENIVWLVQRLVLDDSRTVKATLALLKSTDGGITWRSSFDGVINDCLVVSADGSTLVAGAARTSRPGTGGIYRTTDAGATWTLVYPQGQPEVPPHYYLANAGGTLYAIAVDAVNDMNRREVLMSTDGGVHWTKRADAPRDVRIIFLAASPHDSTLYLGGVGAYRSTDGGLTWKTITTHVDQHAIAFDARDTSRVWIGNDGGLFRSDDGGLTVQSLADRLPVVQFYRVNAHPTDPNVLLGGTQDNGLESRDPGREWTEMFEGDWGTQIFDPASSRVLSNNIGASIARFNSDGSGIVPVTNSVTFGDTRRTSFIAPMVAGSDGTIWFGTHRIFASRDFGTTWSAPAGDLDLTTGDRQTNLDALTAIGVSDSDPRVLYTGSAQGRIMVSKDAGVTWNDITPASTANVSSIAVDATAPGTAYVAFSSFAAHLLKTTTFGATWSDASSGLPELPVNIIYIDRRNRDTLYAGTDIGVFRSDTAGASWEPFNNGMPPVVVTSFTTTADGRLIVGTYGRGVYELTLGEPPQAGRRRRSVRH